MLRPSTALFAVLVPLAMLTGCAADTEAPDVSEATAAPAAPTPAPESDGVQIQRDSSGNPTPREVCLYNCFVDASFCKAFSRKFGGGPVCDQDELQCQQACPAK